MPRPRAVSGDARREVSEELVGLIMAALRDQGGGQATRVPTEIGRETTLFGRDGVLDSMGMVALVVAVEQAIEDEYGVTISLADERALSERKSPYRTIGSLAEYAGRVLEGAR